MPLKDTNGRQRRARQPHPPSSSSSSSRAPAVAGRASRRARRARERGTDRVSAADLLLGMLFTSGVFVLGYFVVHRRELYDAFRDDVERRRKAWEEGPPSPSTNDVFLGSPRERWKTADTNKRGDGAAVSSRSTRGVRTVSSVDSVVAYLNNLLEMPPAKLWTVLGMDETDAKSDGGGYGEDPFSLRDLESGECPWTSAKNEVVEWLPPRPYNSDSIAELYRNSVMAAHKHGNNNGSARWRRKEQMEWYDAKNEVAIWYEHLSKAGGSTFCGLAQSNMAMWQVPRYHCMPTKRELMDGRVGSWTNEELIEHLEENRHAIVSNEWEPFSLGKLRLSKRSLDGEPMAKSAHKGPFLLFLTVLRDPSDRLLSAYTFFGLTTAGKGGNPPTFKQWIENNQARTARYKVGLRAGYRSNTARYNHIVWRFSGGELPCDVPLSKGQWKRPFETAVQALSLHDLVLPMEVMTRDDLGKVAMRELLGWDRFGAKGWFQGGDKETGHVVTQGEVRNSNAREHFSEEEYRRLWTDNWLDHVLYLWCRAVFLARLHCKDVIVES